MSEATSRLGAALADRYQIERELGAGGMATVYLAQDLKHGRQVAIKVLRPELAAVIGAERFLSEIKTTAALQHPHILPLHDSGEADSFLFYVMPFVEGESLRDRLTREQQLPIPDALRIATEVAGALDYAHRHNVIHRDIKPENILLHDGRALVADFGIALAASKAGGTRMTETGMSLGTPTYMSPEQAMGERDITAKSDVYALGCVLYEMLCGEPPFTGPTAQAIIARVMTEEPRSLTLQRKTIPLHVEAAVYTALAKLPADRFASAAEFAAALGNAAYAAPSGTAAHPASGRVQTLVRRPGPAAALSGLVLGALGLVAGWWLGRPRAEPPRMVQFALALPDSARYVDTFGRSVAVAPDGSALVYPGGTAGQHRLYLRRLDEPQPTPIPGTEGGYMPFFSPDGEWLGFVANQRLMKVRLSGGAPTTVAQLLGNIVAGATWGTRDVIVLEDVSGLSHVRASGGRLEQMVPVDARNRLIEWPTFLPDGQAVLCTVTGDAGSHLGLVTVPEGRLTVFDDAAGSDPRFLAPGIVLWLSPEGVELAAPFDARRRRFTGKAVPVVEGVVEELRGAKIGIGPGIAVRVEGTSQRTRLLRLDRRGVSRIELPEGLDYAMPRFSPDGRRIAFVTGQLGGELWVFDRGRGTRQRLALAANARGPEWSGDGRRLVFGYNPGSSWDIYAAGADGSSPAESLVVSPQTESPVGWSPAGVLVFWRLTQNRGDILYRDSAGVEHTFAASTADERSPVLSPDGRWLAYVSDESGRREVYVRPFPSGEGRWQISSEGGIEPRWAKHGHEIIYRDRGWFLAVPLVPGPAFGMGRVDSLFQGSYLLTGASAQYDVSPDGSEFLVIGAATEARTLSVTLNPFDRLLGDRRRSGNP
jgi:serine/threonine-protein kinase